MQHLRSGQDQRARIDAAVAAFRRLAPTDYGHFLATIEGDLGERDLEIAGDPPRLLLAAPTAVAKAPSLKVGSLREAVLGVLSDGQPRSTLEIRRTLEATRTVKAPTLNTEMFTLRKLGLVRSEGNARGRRHTIVGRAPVAASSEKRDRAPRTPRSKRSSDDEDHPASKTSARSPDAAGLYASAIADHHLLTREEECMLARRLEETELAIWKRLLASPLGAVARAQLRALDPPVEDRASAAVARSADSDRRIASRVIAQGQDQLEPEERAEYRALEVEADRIRTRFATCNLRMVPALIRRYGYHRTTSLSMGDLIQEGNIGLLKAISRFDYRRGFRFSTFAAWWIRHYIVRARQNLGIEIRVPVHMQDIAAKAWRVRTKLQSELGRDPTTAEVAIEGKISPESLRTLETSWPRHREPLPTGDSVGEGAQKVTLVSDAAPVDEVLDRLRADDRITAVVASMPPMLAQVVQRRFGIGHDEETLAQIGRAFGLSRERIRQIEKKAIAFLRESLGPIRESVLAEEEHVSASDAE